MSAADFGRVSQSRPHMMPCDQQGVRDMSKDRHATGPKSRIFLHSSLLIPVNLRIRVGDGETDRVRSKGRLIATSREPGEKSGQDIRQLWPWED